jgi:hypothetical protein
LEVLAGFRSTPECVDCSPQYAPHPANVVSGPVDPWGLRKMLEARTLSPDVARAALDALANKRRKVASTVKMSRASLVQAFAQKAERYKEVVRNLGEHVTKSVRSTEERELVNAMLGGHGIVFSRDGRVGARFDCANRKNYL